MQGRRTGVWARGLVWALWMAMTVPWVVGCASAPAERGVHLAGIVVDGQRLVRDNEEAYVRVWRGSQPIPVRTGMRLQKGDRVSTGDRADVVIRYPNGGELFMRPGSSGQIGSITGAIGEFFAKVKGLFSIETEFVKAGVRGTAFDVRAAADGQARVWVFDGRVEVASTRNAWAPVTVRAGSGMVAGRGGASDPRRLSEAEMDGVRDWVDRIERLVPAEPSGGGQAAAAALAIGAMVALLLADQDDRPSASDGPDRRPDATPPSLVAPIGLRPGSTQASQAPQLDCRAPVALSWDRVAGATAYAVTLQMLPPRQRQWRTIASPVSSSTRAGTPGKLDGRLRWWVQARDARGDGPTSATLYFNCTTLVVR